MAEIKDNQIFITDENGNENVFNILFTYTNEERNKSYVFFYGSNDEESLIVMSYDDEGNLYEIEDDEEYDEVEEVFNAYMEDPAIQEIK